MYRNEQHKFNWKIWALLIFSQGHYLPIVACLFVLRILPYLEFDLVFCFMLNKMMATGGKRSKNWQVAVIICNSYTVGCEQTTAIITLYTFYIE